MRVLAVLFALSLTNCEQTPRDAAPASVSVKAIDTMTDDIPSTVDGPPRPVHIWFEPDGKVAATVGGVRMSDEEVRAMLKDLGVDPDA